MSKQHILLFFYLFLSFHGIGQNYLFKTRHLTTEDGLLGHRVKFIVQDNDGFIWLGTNEGINRFDGYRFEHFTKESHGLSANNISTLAKDDQGDIWVNYHTDKYIQSKTQVIEPQKRKPLSIKDKFGASYQEGFDELRIYGNVGEKYLCLNLLDGKKKVIYQDGKLKENTLVNGAYHKNGNVFWTTRKNKIYKHTIDNKIVDSLSVENALELYLQVTSNDNLFVLADYEGGKQTLFFKKKNTKQLQSISIATSIKEGMKLLKGGAAWQSGFLYFDYKGKVGTYSSKLIEKAMNFVVADNQNNIWLPIENGLLIVSGREQVFNTYFKNYGKDGGNYDGRGIWANHKYLYSFSSKGSYQWDFEQETSKEILIDQLEKPNYISTTSSRNNTFWVGGKDEQLLKIDENTKEIVKKINVIKSQIWSLLEDKNDRLWLGQNRGGLLYYDPQQMESPEKYTQLNGINEINVRKIIHIVEDKRNNNYLWIAAQSGWYLLHIKDGMKARFSNTSPKEFQIPTDEIHYTYQDKEGIYWLATAHAGLLKVTLTQDYKIKVIEQFSTKDGLTSNTINTIFEDEEGFLWMSSNNGIIRFNKKSYSIRAFLEEDGLPHYEFNRTSGFQRKDGTLFFGSLNGLIGFHPKDLQAMDAYDIPLKISKCEKYSNQQEKIIDVTEQVLQEKRIVVAPNERFITLYVSLQDYSDVSRVRYAYRINGFQEEFTFSNSNEVILSGLPYGKYQLEIKAQGKDGRFSKQTIKIPLIVKHPFYLRWWFILLTISSLVLIVWQIMVFRTQSLKNRQQELEEIVKKRTAQLRHQATQLEKDKNLIEKQAKELRSLDEMKSHFFANISHELRTPLTLILSPIRNILKRQKVDNRDFTSAKIAEQNAKKLLKRINEILDLTKLEAGKMELKPQPTLFYEFNKRLVASFESLAAQKNQQITFNYQLDKALNISLDRDKYEHIVNNYLSNAIKYTTNNGKIDIELYEKQSPNTARELKNQLVLAVRDNGQGIVPQDLPKVFDRFFQSKQDRNKSSSSGIGLALSREIAQLMAGTVWVESEVGEGSTFYFEMPYVEELGRRSEVPNSIISIEKSSLLNLQGLVNLSSSPNNKSTILLVEDNPQLRNYIQLILQEKYHVMTAENGKVALDKLNNSQKTQQLINLIISDIMMPVMDGFELLEKLKSSDELRQIPVVMLTARSNIKDKLEALRIGVDDYILKPFEEEELTARIDNLIRNAKNRMVAIPEIRPQTKSAKQKTPKQIAAADMKWLEQIEKRLKEEISNSKFNIEALATELNISRSQIQRRIKKTTGLSPTQYFRTIKLQTAREMLESGTVQTVNEVAYAVGFDTPHYFSKLYYQHFGKKPIEYLK